MKITIVTDHATWCEACIECLSASNPGVRVFGKVLCLACLERMRKALVAQAEEDKVRAR